MSTSVPGGEPEPPPAVPRLTDLVIISVAMLVGLTIWGRSQPDPGAAWLVWDLVIGGLACACLPVMRRYPVAGALAATVLAALSPAATPPATLSVLYVAQQRRFRIPVAVAVTGIAAHAVQGWWQPVGGISYGWWLVLMSVAYAALVGWGTLARAHRALVASLRERATRAEAEQAQRVAEARGRERARIAWEMHDVLAHRLSLVATHAGALEYRPDAPPEQLSRAAGVVRAGVHQALDELRDVIGVLREDAGDDGCRFDTGSPAGAPSITGPTAVRPPPGLADLDQLLAESRGAGMQVRLRDEVADRPELPAATGRTAYRVVQEALTNSRRHAAGQPVEVSLEGCPGSHLAVEIRNRLATGAAAVPQTRGTGTGLVGLAERVTLAGGRLEHQATAGGDFRLAAWLPWPG